MATIPDPDPYSIPAPSLAEYEARIAREKGNDPVATTQPETSQTLMPDPLFILGATCPGYPTMGQLIDMLTALRDGTLSPPDTKLVVVGMTLGGDKTDENTVANLYLMAVADA